MESEEKLWTVLPNASAHSNSRQQQLHVQQRQTNRIKTTKYSWLTFLPKNLFEQFHRFANIYFLSIIILNWVPAVNAFGKEIAMFPLMFVLLVTAVKDLFEDRRRYQSDQEINNKNCKSYNRWAYYSSDSVLCQLNINLMISSNILLASQLTVTWK